MRHLRRGLELKPDLPGLHRELASALQQRTPADSWARNEAIAAYAAAIRLAPSDDESYFQLGRLHGQTPLPTLERFEDAVGDDALDPTSANWRHAIRVNPKAWQAHHSLSAPVHPHHSPTDLRLIH